MVKPDMVSMSVFITPFDPDIPRSLESGTPYLERCGCRCADGCCEDVFCCCCKAWGFTVAGDVLDEPIPTPDVVVDDDELLSIAKLDGSKIYDCAGALLEVPGGLENDVSNRLCVELACELTRYGVVDVCMVWSCMYGANSSCIGVDGMLSNWCDEDL